MFTICKRIADHQRFAHFITAVILFAGLLVGVETYPSMHERFHTQLHVLDQIVLAIFTLEVIVKVLAHGKKPWLYFTDPWNVFDFIVVSASFMPMGEGGEAIVVLRLVRLLRVLKLVRALPKLQLLVSALLKSIPSMAYVSILLFLLFYVYGVAAVFLFGKNDPLRFATLQLSLLTLFRTVTLESWGALMDTQRFGCDVIGYESFPQLCTQPSAHPIAGPIFFVSFVLIGTMIILNLFIGVIMNGMNEAQSEAEAEERKRTTKQPAPQQELGELLEQMAALQTRLAALHQRLGQPEPAAPRLGHDGES